MTNDLADLDARIESAERGAIAKSMCGLWEPEDDTRLAALYEERRTLHREKGNSNGRARK